ncbi:hypothetical protein [Microlunatus speluncae]|uniref:hypothetical protein n=1 Tax=Microlunatus speluncae TaxID=2594267 RepID=UPI0012663014|nr:hypothetical protein [Microlunatus speluncae]
MRILSRLGLIILLALGGVLATASVAAAGGPTSLLISNPQNQRTAAAYVGDARYERLGRLVGMNTAAGINQSVPGESPPVGLESDFGAETRLTWLIHDMAVWRVDRIYLTGNAVWINTMTTTDWGSGELGDGLWHRAADPKQVRAALTETGVLKPAAAERPDSDQPGSVAEPEPSASEPVGTAAAASTGGPPLAGLIGFGSGLLGLAAGIAGTLLTLRGRSRSRPDRVVLTG